MASYLPLPLEIVEHVISYLPFNLIKTLAAQSDSPVIQKMAKYSIQKTEKYTEQRADKLIPFPSYTGTKLEWIYHLNGYESLNSNNITVEPIPIPSDFSDQESVSTHRISKGSNSIVLIDEQDYRWVGRQERWYNEDGFHRINGPAVVQWLKLPDIKAEAVYKLWYLNGTECQPKSLFNRASLTAPL
jgi:hypothetical protein